MTGEQTSKLDWSRLTPLQVGKYAEYFVKMEFTKHGFAVYASEVDDKGIDFVVCTEKPRRHYDVQVKSVKGFNYVFFRKEHFDLGDNLYAALVIQVEGEQPELYLVPSRARDEPNQLISAATTVPRSRVLRDGARTCRRRTILG